MVSHEFRTPLSVIAMAADLLGGYGQTMTDAERSEQLKEIHGAVGRMTKMLTDFLVHGVCTSGKMECKPARVEVGTLCRRIIAEGQSPDGSPRTIELQVDSAVGEAWLDEKILRHILGNLLSNAVKYSSDGQPVKLEVKRIGGSPQPGGDPDPSSEPRLEFKVSDSGIGIPAADLAKLYQTFHRAANVGNRPGSGMGLAIVKQFVDLHRGTIRLESQEGTGTTVWVEIPITIPRSHAKSQQQKFICTEY
jgi:signal transduction histidine kinase